jgi:hypothetical protein
MTALISIFLLDHLVGKLWPRLKSNVPSAETRAAVPKAS